MFKKWYVDMKVTYKLGYIGLKQFKITFLTWFKAEI